jgi:hypothetical protein
LNDEPTEKLRHKYPLSINAVLRHKRLIINLIVERF